MSMRKASMLSFRGGDNGSALSDDDLLPSKKGASSSNNSKSENVQQPVAQNTGSTPAATIVKVFEANAYKIVSGQYQFQGRFGVALLANSGKSEFKLLIYASGNVVVTQALINSTFSVSISNSVYVSLYDTFNQNWSFHFDQQDKVDDFVRHITIAKFRSSNSNVVFCDLTSPNDSEPNLALGDSAEVRYTGWILQPDGQLGAVFETNNNDDGALQRVKVGKCKSNKAWDVTLIGMIRGGRRFVAAPAKKVYSSKNAPPKVVLTGYVFFDVEVVRVKCQAVNNNKDATQSLQAQLDNMSTSSSATVDNYEPPLPLLPDDSPTHDAHVETLPDIKDRAHSISENLENPTKQVLLSRMKRMGQSMLPPASKSNKKMDSEDDIDDSDSNTDATSTRSQSISKPQVPPKYRPSSASVIEHAPESTVPPSTPVYQPQQPSTYQSVPYSTQQHPSMVYNSIISTQPPSNQLAPYSSMRPGTADHMYNSAYPNVPPAQVQQMPSQTQPPNFPEQMHSAMLVNETRQQNTEMRIAISKLQDKVDNVLNTVKDQKIQESRQLAVPSIVPTMETTVLLQNLTRIIQDNEHFRADLMQKGEKIEKQNVKISSLLLKNEQLQEEINNNNEHKSQTFTQNASQSQARVLQLEEQKLKLVQDLSKRTSEIYDLQIQLDEYKKESTDSIRKLTTNVEQKDVLHIENDALKLKNNDLQNDIATLKEKYKELNQSRKLLQQERDGLKQVESDVKQDWHTHEQVLKDKISRLEMEKSKTENEMEAFKKQSEQDLDQLREKLRQERANLYSDSSVKQNVLEEEITDRWKKRCDQLVKAETEKFERRLREVEEDKNRLEAECQNSVTKLASFKSQTRDMKQTMVEEITKLTNEVEELTEQLVFAQKAEAVAIAALTKESNAAEEVAGQIKAIMNTVYRSLKDKFVADKKYDGSRIHKVAMDIILKTTLRLMNKTGSDDDEEEEEEDESEDEEEEQDDEEDEEEAEVAEIEEQVEESTHQINLTDNNQVQQTISQNTLPNQSIKSSFSNDEDAKSNIIGGIDKEVTVKTTPLEKDINSLSSKPDSVSHESETNDQELVEEKSTICVNDSHILVKQDTFQSIDKSNPSSDVFENSRSYEKTDNDADSFVTAQDTSKTLDKEDEILLSKPNEDISQSAEIDSKNEEMSKSPEIYSSENDEVSNSPDIVSKNEDVSKPPEIISIKDEDMSNSIENPKPIDISTEGISSKPTEAIASSKPNTPVTNVKPTTGDSSKTLFEDSGDEDIFSPLPSKPLVKKSPDDAKAKETPVKSLFGDSDDDMAWLNT